MKRIDLCGKWECSGYAADDTVTTKFDGKKYWYQHTCEGVFFTGTVPGCVHTDLINCGKTEPDIFWRDNAENLQWIENYNWCYSKKFEFNSLSDNIKLVFEGLDVYCDIYLNNEHLGYCDDMFVPYSFDVDGIIKEGENIIEVYFYSPKIAASGRKIRNFAFTGERLYTRRMQCTYGWDWVGRFLTCGIFRPVYLEIGNEMSVESTYIYTESIDKFGAQLVLKSYFTNYKNGEIVHFRVISPDGFTVFEDKRFCNEEFCKHYIDIENPQLWYPNGYGNQPLYKLEITVKDNVYVSSFGIRTVKILQLEDKKDSENYNICKALQKVRPDKNEKYSGFAVVVNGVKIFCKGANWVPCEPFASVNTDEKITKILSLSKSMGVNILRLWGGGITETEHFYQKCDELGIMLIHDFFFACGNYPEKDKSFETNVKKEVKHIVTTLRNHPCIVWWNGDNEMAANGSCIDKDYPGRHNELQTIAPIVEKFDGKRIYFPSSPYAGVPNASATRGTTHNTGFGLSAFMEFADTGRKDLKCFYDGMLSRFSVEEPIMGAAENVSLKKFMAKDDIHLTEEEMLCYHSKGNSALVKELYKYPVTAAQNMFGAYTDAQDKYFKLRYLQYYWVTVSMELYRRNKGFCGGMLYWMLNDCWPAAIGWSMIDYYTLPKSGYYAFKNCGGNKIITSFSYEDGGVSCYITSDEISDKRPKVSIKQVNIKNQSVKELFCAEAEVKAGTSQRLVKIECQSDCILICDCINGDERNRSFYVQEPMQLKRCDTTISYSANSVTITADRYIHAVNLQGEAVFEDNYFQVLPGETREIIYKKAGANDKISVICYTVDRGE